MNELEHTIWRIFSWALTLSPVIYTALRLVGVINYGEDGFRIYGLVVVAFMAWTARKFMDS